MPNSILTKFRVMIRILIMILIGFAINCSWAYDLTREDSLELKLIENEHPNMAQHLHLYIADLQSENDALKAKVEALESNSDTKLTLILIVVFTLIILGLIAFIYRLRARDRKEIEQHKNLADKAAKSLAEREKFLAYTNHEIRTPLNAVSGSAELLATTELSPGQEKYVKTIKASVDNVLILVNDVLDLSRIESGNIEFRKDDFLLSDVMMGVSYILSEKVDKKGISFFVEVDEKIPTILKGDSRFLNQILINLCNNAVKFTDLGKVTLKATLLNNVDQNYSIRFEVIDTGKGIRKSKISTIFNQFEQETRHTIQTKGGSGLGLAITKQLVESMGGEIKLDSKYLEGTTFTVDLNFAIGSEQRIIKEKIDTSVIDNQRILVVDDNRLNRDIVEDVLGHMNKTVHVTSADSGAKAIELLKLEDFDLILMDIQMPNMDGYELTKYIRGNIRSPFNEIPIIAMTAYAMDNVAEACFEAGMNDFITKPINWQFLLTKIDRLNQKKMNNKGKDQLVFDNIDLGTLKRLTAGDNTKMFKYIDIFLDNVPRDLEQMKAQLKERNHAEALKILHKIKGNTTYMGNQEIAEIYDKLCVEKDLTHAGSELNQAVVIAEKCAEELKLVKKNYKLLFLEIN